MSRAKVDRLREPIWLLTYEVLETQNCQKGSLTNVFYFKYGAMMRQPANKNEILEFIFDCKKRDELILGYLSQEAWTPAMAAMIVCGVRPLLQTHDQIPDTGLGLDNQELHASSSRLRNARNLLANWTEEYEEDEQTPPESVAPHEYLNWCIDSGYITDWLRLIGNLCNFPVEPGFSINNGGISDTERITIMPNSLMSALIVTAKSPVVLDNTLRQAVTPATENSTSLPLPGVMDAPPSKVISPLLSKKKPLTRVIELARQKAEDPNDSELIWLELIRLARSDKPPKPLSGYAPSEGIKWIDEEKGEDVVQFLRKDAFEKRLEREYKTSISKRKRVRGNGNG